jgi:hypothetical protein
LTKADKGLGYERRKKIPPKNTKMKKTLLALAMGAFLTAMIVTSCDTPQENVADAKENLHDAQVTLKQSRKDSVEAAEWATFKATSEEMIQSNNITIADLRTKNTQNGKFMDVVQAERIVALEAKNAELQKRIDDYEKYHSNWETFKREFDHDIAEISKTMKEVSTNNTK